MKLTFIVDKKIDLRFAKNATQKKDIETAYKTGLPVLRYTTRAYQEAWDEINDRFSTFVEKTTGVPWKHARYKCVVSVEHQGISNWDGSNLIVRWWRENPYLARSVTAHELILHHHFRILNE